MSRQWIEANRNEFARDVMRDFCMANHLLTDQFSQFEATGIVSFAAMRDFLGNMMNKGLMWRLKDTAHHLFRMDPKDDTVARMLDWTIGYIFHECIKLKEDAYQQQHYAPLFKALQRQGSEEPLDAISTPLASVLTQTSESISREVTRIKFLLEQCCNLICLYYRQHGENRVLARLLFDRNELVRSVFKDTYDTLIANIYQDVPERMYIQAAESLIEGGRPEEAIEAGTEAIILSPTCKSAKAIKAEAEQLLLLQTTTPRRIATNDTVTP